ncbi:ANL family adenylate-forming protein [Lonsdalea quercina]|uniref:ANL family adenylate-forming protein n=1 Tax=Lonsdalea quercina TaxID=71657 RepID=UPI0039755B56
MSWLLNKLEANKESDAIVVHNKTYSYRELIDEINFWTEVITVSQIPQSSVVSIQGENSLSLISLFFSLYFNGCIIVPLNSSAGINNLEYQEIAEADYSINLDESFPGFHKTSFSSNHVFYKKLRDDKSSGIVLFSSGTTGKPKAMILNMNKMMSKFRDLNNSLRILSFLSYDHIGGINTILHTLCGGGCVIFSSDKTPKNVLSTIDRWHVQVLPTTPTFINMLLMSDLLARYDLSTLSLVTYGTEPMPPITLQRISEKLPNIKFKQTYGLSEVGILPTKSKNNNELWLKIGGEGFNYKIIDSILWIKSNTAMLGYLNAESPFDDDGYFNTQDLVEVDGEYIRILGRKSEIINVAGEKVYPAEVEGLLGEIPGVLDVIVTGMKNPITGMGIKAFIKCNDMIDRGNLKTKIIKYTSSRLEKYKQPMVYTFTTEDLHSCRFKKKRSFTDLKGLE